MHKIADTPTGPDRSASASTHGSIVLMNQSIIPKRLSVQNARTPSSGTTHAMESAARALLSSSIVLPIPGSPANADYRVTRPFVAMQRLLNRLRSVVGFPHATGHGLACQIWLAYSAIVRSLENFPDAATFMIALPAQAWGSAYRACRRPSASR